VINGETTGAPYFGELEVKKGGPTRAGEFEKGIKRHSTKRKGKGEGHATEA